MNKTQIYRVFDFLQTKSEFKKSARCIKSIDLNEPSQNQRFILIYKHLNDNIHFFTICRVNISHQIKRKNTLYLHRETKPSVVGRNLMFSRGVSTFLHDHHHRCATRFSCPSAAVSQTLVCFLPGQRLGSVRRKRVKCYNALTNVVSVGCSLEFETQPMYNVPAAVDASCTPQTEITAAIDHTESYMMLHIRCAKSIWFYSFEKPFCICRLQLKCPEIHLSQSTWKAKITDKCTSQWHWHFWRAMLNKSRHKEYMNINNKTKQ